MRSKPSPITVPWLLVEAVRPSTLPESYEIFRSGFGFTAAGGTRRGYDQVKVPDEPPASQVDEAASGVAL